MKYKEGNGNFERLLNICSKLPIELIMIISDRMAVSNNDIINNLDSFLFYENNLVIMINCE